MSLMNFHYVPDESRLIDAPVLSRVHQEMSYGMYGFQQACKLEDTPFPFPYAQMVAVMLALMSLLGAL